MFYILSKSFVVRRGEEYGEAIKPAPTNPPLVNAITISILYIFSFCLCMP